MILLRKYWPLLIIIAFTLTGAWYLWHPESSPPETYKAPVVQSDGSIILERKPDPTATPVAKTPKGSVVERIVRVTVQGGTPFVRGSGSVEVITRVADKAMSKPVMVNMSSVVCPPVNVEIVLVKNKDETRSVIVSSDNGTILGGVDIPVESAKPAPKPLLWAVGGVYNPFKQTSGGFVDRDFGWLRTGVQVNQASDTKGIEGWIKAGLRF